MLHHHLEFCRSRSHVSREVVPRLRELQAVVLKDENHTEEKRHLEDVPDLHAAAHHLKVEPVRRDSFLRSLLVKPILQLKVELIAVVIQNAVASGCTHDGAICI